MANINQQLADTFNAMADGLMSGQFGKKLRIGLTLIGSEHGSQELLRGAQMVARQYSDIEPVLIGCDEPDCGFECYPAVDLHECHKVMESLFAEQQLDGCVTLHYAFPLGVSTMGKVVTPSTGREMIIASTTGTTDTQRQAAMLKNAIYGIALAKSTGIEKPTIGVLNVDGAAVCERALRELKQGGYDIEFAQSGRADGGIAMRGNDLLQGTPDVMVTDSLTGNLLMKMFSSFTTGGSYEASGFGYGPGLGEGATKQPVNIISRASGAPVVAGAMRLCADAARGEVMKRVDEEWEAATLSGLNSVLTKYCTAKPAAEQAETVVAPPEKVTDAEIGGIDILAIEYACQALWKANIFARTGMGCTGPIVLVAKSDLEQAKIQLVEADYIS
ncbi:glycine/sarcosine/betaine reductase complex component C subunit alpha [Photobacterium rosenbergii]|uniref:Glycine/sarcosine/betaine reductase complex component C subunit alpha n=1 Tax=Photobacterium rosenbergii TaxID=294936 RepID=A0ABU3ZCW5_9GAMM|nr:glycine/sarcosine/betaine reductase complex component C subunit alpha [Photobacterium rosenbergii]MDV5167956.1 glycine/sarcosine/betaine reductase complex component C subunit alpha [Photobacterium rosenbergii]